MKKNIFYIIFSFLMIFGSYLYLSPLEDEKDKLLEGEYRLTVKYVNKDNKPAKFHDDRNGTFSIHPGDINASVGYFTFYLNKTILLDFSIKKEALAGDILYKIVKNGDILDSFIVKSKPRINKRINIDVKYGDVIEISADKHGSLAYDWGSLQISKRGVLYEFNKYVIPFLWFMLFVFLSRKRLSYLVINTYFIFILLLVAEKLNFGLLTFYEISIYMLLCFSITFFFVYIYQELSIFKKFKLISIFSTLVTLIIYAIPLSFIIYNLNFKTVVTNEILFAIFQTNGLESYEFVFDFIKFKYIFLFLFIVIIVAILFYKQEKKDVDKTEKTLIILLIILFFSVSISQVESLRLPHFVLSGFEKYTKEIKFFKEVQEKRKTNKIKFSSKKDGKGETYIVLIGESLNKKHMGIYGYFRNTTPLLNEMKNNIIIYNNAYSNHTVTTYVLSLALTEANQYNNKNYYESLSIIDILKKANIETYWLTNQATYGAFDNLITVVAKTADYFYPADIVRYDGRLIKKLKRILSKKTDKNRVIFMHLLGNHYTYSLRYPKAKYSFYQDNVSLGEFGSVGSLNKDINQYDNSVLYNDFVVTSILKELQKEKGVSGFLYFSDHGEDVVRNRSHNPNLFTYDMIHIPMIAWFSNEYQEKYSSKYETLKKRKNKLFSNDMIYDTLLGIFNINTDKYNSKYDLSSRDYSLSDNEALILHKYKKYKNKDNYIYYQDYNKNFIDNHKLFSSGVYGINSIGTLNDIINAKFSVISTNIVFDKSKKEFYIKNNNKKTELSLERYMKKIDLGNLEELVLSIDDIENNTFNNILDRLNKINYDYNTSKKITLSTKMAGSYIKSLKNIKLNYIYDISNLNLNDVSIQNSLIEKINNLSISNILVGEDMFKIIKNNIEPKLNKKLLYYIKSDIKLSSEKFIKDLENKIIYRDENVKRILFKYNSKYDDISGL